MKESRREHLQRTVAASSYKYRSSLCRVPPLQDESYFSRYSSGIEFGTVKKRRWEGLIVIVLLFVIGVR